VCRLPGAYDEHADGTLGVGALGSHADGGRLDVELYYLRARAHLVVVNTSSQI